MKLDKGIRVGAVAALALAVGAPALVARAEGSKTAQNPKITAATETRPSQDEALAKRRERLVADSVAALEATNRALDALTKDDAKGALAQLEVASGKLDLLVSRYPETSMLPVDIDVTEVDVTGPNEEIEAIVETAEDALDDGHVQLARSMLMPLASELVFTTTELPLAVYPSAMRLVAPLIDEGKLDEAREALEDALDTLVVRKEIVPLPVLRAELLLAAAEDQLKAPMALEEGASSSKGDAAAEDEPSPATLLAAARHQLERANLLGYGDAKRTYPDLAKRVEKLEKSLSAEPTADGKARMRKRRESLAGLGSKLLQ